MAHSSTNRTITRSAIQMKVGYRIVAHDGVIHTVTAVEHLYVGNGITEFDTDTGIHVRAQGWERQEHAYDVLM